MKYHDRVKEISTSIGPNNIRLGGTISMFVKFSSRFNVSDRFEYAIVSRIYDEWEVGIGYLSSPTSLVRETVLESSANDGFVSFSEGIKDVYNNISGNRYPTQPDTVFTASGIDGGGAATVYGGEIGRNKLDGGTAVSIGVSILDGGSATSAFSVRGIDGGHA